MGMMGTMTTSGYRGGRVTAQPEWRVSVMSNIFPLQRTGIIASKYKGPRPIEGHHPTDQIYLPLFVSYLLLSLPNFSNLQLVVLPSSPRGLNVF
jgi:hypothetical protein